MVVMRNGMMEVRVGMGDDVAAVLASTEQVGSGAQQYILLEIRYAGGNNCTILTRQEPQC